VGYKTIEIALMSSFIITTKADLASLINKREGEVKFGECVQTIEDDNWEEALKASAAKFVLVGIPEDIGVRANYGIGGTHSLWQPALKALLNVQESKCLKGEQLLVLGAFDFNDIIEQSKDKTIEELRELVGFIDDTVAPIIQKIAAAGKVPIVIGGGHNNAFPVLKGISEARKAALNCINLDAHTDFRQMEGRHSGNGFRYAHREGFLTKYEVIGRHET
jgi:formiminoglutamase